MIEVKEISSEETHSVRHPVLRKGYPPDSCIFQGDNDKTTIHLGCFIEHNLVGVVSLFQKEHHNFLATKPIQIRGMAVLNHYRGLGYGDTLLKQAEQKALENNCDFIWFNARINAVGFYERFGYQKYGSVFDIENVGKHFVMFKKLT